jgi:hypothetical protein
VAVWNMPLLPRFIRTACVVAGILTLPLSAAPLFAADTPPRDRDILRYDPLLNALVPVAESEVKTGYVYSHFSTQLNRRVWAIRQAGGQFSNALGEGTIQPARAFDMPESLEARLEKLEQVDKDLYLRLQNQGGLVYFRLGNDDRWKLAPRSTFPTVYDAQTLYRWKWAGNRYIPVSSGPFAYRWRVVDGQYVPIENEPSELLDGRCSRE